MRSRAPGAYRLSGPLRANCVRCPPRPRLQAGVHDATSGRARWQPARVVVLYVGQREPRHRQHDIWTILHDLFGVDNPPLDDHRPPCCERNMPEIDQNEILDAFVEDLQRMVERPPLTTPAPQ